MSTTRAIFAESGHFTAMHNALFDWVQPRLSLSAWSVLCVIVRRTRGWNKKYDAISYDQIMAATGIKSTATISKALNELLSEFPFGRPLLRRQKSAERIASRRQATRYALNPRFEILLEASDQKPEAGEDSPQRHGDTEDLREEKQLVEACLGAFLSPASNTSPLREPESEAVTGGEDAPTPTSGSLVPPGHSFSPPLPFSVSPCLCGESSPPRSGASKSEGRTRLRPLENEETKETPLSYEVENWKCDRTSARASEVSGSDANSPSLLASVCVATMRDPAIVSAKMKAQLVACAARLGRAGYNSEHVERAAALWPYPTAPTPAQLLDNIAALLGARPSSSHAKPSTPAASTGASPTPRASGTPRASHRDSARPETRSRFECAAERKGRKWADWLAELGDA